MKTCEITGYIKRIEQLSGSLSGIQEGHWCVLSESSHLLIHVQSVLKMPVGETDLLDGSVGRHWSKYRKNQPWATHKEGKCTYKFPDGRYCHPNTYHFDELGKYREWEQTIYRPTIMPDYLERKYGKIRG
ncbi:hypothetical protein QUA70_08340 [Microcoleus sp. LAD1_D5]|uniref:hypothetical protein n=1 Tax=unclassified Microcoleus TaxID=2642155 RepID=UPI002FD0C112